MSDDPASADTLRRALNRLLSLRVRPFLRTHGFTKTGRTFRRERHPLYDMINFQGDRWNGVTPQHSFFVNVGVGSTEIDAVHCEWPDRTPAREYILDRRWGRLIPDLPGATSFDADTDLDVFADRLIHDLARLLDVVDSIDSSPTLARWAADNNLLHHMEKTCRFLVATGDTDTLTTYVITLRERLREDSRWTSFNRQLVQVTDRYAAGLISRGLLDPVELGCCM